MSVRALARRLGMDHQHLQQIVSGEVLPGLRTLRRLSTGLATSLERVVLACEEAAEYRRQRLEGLRVLAEYRRA